LTESNNKGSAANLHQGIDIHWRPGLLFTPGELITMR
jgi:hypothetical protein